MTALRILRLDFVDRWRDLLLLLARLGLGASFAVLHGWPKLAGGQERWRGVGSAMQHLGVDFAWPMWGFLATMAEFGGGILVALGLYTRFACLGLVATMAVAATMHIGKGQPLMEASHAIEAGLGFLLLMAAGPGRHSLDSRG